ncbi:MAG: hypothetical protein AAF561_16305, partial [Planctomycetota bacterium]
MHGAPRLAFGGMVDGLPFSTKSRPPDAGTRSQWTACLFVIDESERALRHAATTAARARQSASMRHRFAPTSTHYTTGGARGDPGNSFGSNA